jgi:hypothetical protein
MSPATKLLIIWILGLVASLVIISAFQLFGVGSWIKEPIPTITGVSQFAVFYLMAQFVERLVELVSDSPLFSESKKKPSRHHEEWKHEDELDDPDQWKRTIQLWCVASILGIFMCYFTIGLFQMVGVTFATGGHAMDSAFSGIVIGGGTKPLHDVIGYLQSKNP